MTTHPTAQQLLQAVIDWLGGAQRDGYMALVARNALGIVQRELAQGEAADAAALGRLRDLLGSDGDFAELELELSARIRDGAVAPDDPALLRHLRLQIIDRLAIDQPKYKSSLVLSFKKELLP
jgi:hypothetical protein